MRGNTCFHELLLDRFGGAPGWGDFVVGKMVMKSPRIVSRDQQFKSASLGFPT